MASRKKTCAVVIIVCIVIIIIVIILCLLYAQPGYLKSEDEEVSEDLVIYEGSRCKRDCNTSSEAVLCTYNFDVEWYYSLSKACYDCPVNRTDCDRKDCIPLNGVQRALMVVNRKLPGPSIEVCEGDEVEVTVTNLLENAEGLSIHWHGLHQRDSQYMDGVSMVTQCPITSPTSFKYKFTAYPAGTHWWHSHSGMQRADGIFGAFIVKKPKSEERYNYDYDKHHMLVTDWLHDLTIAKYTEYHHFIGTNGADSILINGKGINETVARAGKTATTPREEFMVERGNKYRFRVISGAITNCGLKISIDDHRISMIASDGSAINDQETDSFIIYAGERYDFILNANKAVKNYWIRVNGEENGCKQLFELAVLRYEGAGDSDPDGVDGRVDKPGTTVNALVDNIDNVNDDDISIWQLTAHEDDDVTFPDKPVKTFYIGMVFNKIDNIHFHDPEHYPFQNFGEKLAIYTPQLNHISFGLPPSPPLSQYDDLVKGTLCAENTIKDKNCVAKYCQCTHAINVTLDDIVELVVVNEGTNTDTSHPMHLHGHYFRVIGYDKLGKSTTVEEVKELDKQGKLERRTHLALQKDTVIVPYGGYAILRFHADNPGWWFFHCHLEYHVEIGMAMIVHVGEQDDLGEAPESFPECNHFPRSCSKQTQYSILVFISIIFTIMNVLIDVDHF